MTKNQSWEQNLREFNERGVLGRFMKSKNQLILSAIQGRKPDKVDNSPQWQRSVYNGIYRTSFEGWPVTIEQAEISVNSPEYLTSQRPGLDLEKLKKSWGDKKENMRCGGIVRVDLGEIDRERKLAITHQEFLGADYGTFMDITLENCRYLHVKFDYSRPGTNPKIPSKYGFTGQELYDYVEKLVEMSRECCCGISTKPIETNSKGNVLHIEKGHIYPELNIHDSEFFKARKIGDVYAKGKELWGENFKINTHSRGDENMKRYLDSIEKFNI